jgi:hypothetical protein
MRQLSRIGTGSFVAAAAGVIVMVTGGPAFASTATQLPVDGTGLPALTSIAVAPGGSEWAVGSRWDGTTGNSTPLAYRVIG